MDPRTHVRRAWWLALPIVVGCSSPMQDPARAAGAERKEKASLASVTEPRNPAEAIPVVRFVPMPEAARKAVPLVDALAVGDQIRITVMGQLELSLEVPIPPLGVIEMPVVGSVRLIGRTCADVSKDIEASLCDQEFLIDPKVSVVVSEFAPRQVFVVEGVQKPQAYDLPMGRPLFLTQVISMAGGLAEGADPSQASILRRSPDGTSGLLQVDLRALLDGHEMASDPVLHPGDTVVVRDLKQGEGVVYVTGQVRKPGAYRYPLREGLTFFQAVVLAGGLDKYAKPSGALLMRDVEGERQILPIDLDEVLSGALDRDVRLSSQDVLFVPESFF